MLISIFISCEATDDLGGNKTENHNGEAKYTIGVASNNFNDKWQTYMLDAIREQSRNYPEYEFIFSDGEEDSAKQIGQVEDFISMGVDGIILVAVNTDAAAPMTNAAKKADIPLVTVNRLLANQEEATAYVGSESIKGGIVQAEIIYEMMNGTGNVAILMGPAGNESAVERTAGYYQVAEDYPDIHLVAEEYGNWNREEAMQIVENWLQGGLEFDAILSNNDEMAIGAILALEGQGVRNDYLVAGLDATLDALEFMKEDRLDATVFQSAEGQGKAAVDTIIKAILSTLEDGEI